MVEQNKEFEWVNQDKTVFTTLRCSIRRGRKVLSILKFQAKYPVMENTQRTLESFRKRFDIIEVYSVGASRREHMWAFWKYQKRLKLVNVLYDNNGNKIR